jgi:hypothetical protein
VKLRTMREGDGPDAERLTRAGRWLRATSLDELPELWNVLRGEDGAGRAASAAGADISALFAAAGAAA